MSELVKFSSAISMIGYNTGRFILIIIWIFLSWGNNLFSQESNDRIESEPIEVVETNKNRVDETTQKDSTGFHSEIQLKDSKERYNSLPEILERESGLRVRQFGGLGSYSTLSIRGSNPNQSRFYVDGIPFNNSQSGEVNLADLPFDNLSAVEVYRSGVPLGFAGSAIGGVVNLRTMKPERNRTRLQLGGGSFYTGRGSFSLSRITDSKKVGYTLFGIVEKSDQNFSFLNDQGTIFNSLDDSVEKRKNSQFERAQGTASLFFQIGGTDLRLLADLNHRKHGVPGPANNQKEKTIRKYSRLTTAVTTTTPEFFHENLQLESRLYFAGFKDEFFDPRSEFSSGRPNSLTFSDNLGFQLTPTLYMLNYYQIFKFSMGGEWEDFRRDRRNANHTVLEKEPIRKRRYRNVQVQDEIRLFSARFIIVPGVSWDEYYDIWENDFPLGTENRYTKKTTQFTNPRIGFLWKAIQHSKHNLDVKANINRQSRIPSFLEIFGERGQILGNSNILPEKSRNWDFGISYLTNYKSIKSETGISYFNKRIQDMILFIPNSQFSLRAENESSANIEGVETSQIFNLYNWKWVINYTYQKAINASEGSNLKGKYLPLRPMHEVFSSLSYNIDRFTIGMEWTYIGAVFRDRTNEYVNYLPARDIYGLFSSYTFWKNDYAEEARFTFEIKNVGDNRFSDFIGYPLPGRMWYAGVSYVF